MNLFKQFYHLPVYETAEITSSGSNSEGGRLALTCRVELRGKLNELLPFVQLKWVGPSGFVLTNNPSAGIFIDLQKYSSSDTSLTLTFDPLSTDHSGLYRCRVSISKPSLVPFFERELRYEITVISKCVN